MQKYDGKENYIVTDVRLSLLLHLFKRHNLFIKIWEWIAGVGRI